MRVFPVTWQRWRSHHSIRHIRKPNAVRKLRGSIFYRTGVICYCRLKFYIAGIGNFALSAVVSLTLIRWPSYSNLTSIPSRHPRRTKMDFMPCGFRKLSHYKKKHKYRRECWKCGTGKCRTKNARPENSGPKCRGGKCTTGKCGTENARLEIAGLENAGPWIQM